MGLDVFGRALSASQRASRGPPGIGINLTKEGHYDVQNKRIINVATPENPGDCTPYGVLTEMIQTVETKIERIQDLLKKLKKDMNETYATNMTEDGNFDMQNKRITNLALPQHIDDCVPYGMLLERFRPVNERIADLEKSREEMERKMKNLLEEEIPQINRTIQQLLMRRGGLFS